MSSCSPSSSSSAFQDESGSGSREAPRKIIRIRLVMKRPEVEPDTEELAHAASEDSGSSGRVCNSERFTGRSETKRKHQFEADTNIEDAEASTRIVTSPLSGVETRSASFMASARNAAEREATRSRRARNNKKVKSVATSEGPKTHKCKSCPAAFATGQELGGHMRAHFKGFLTLSASSSSKRAKNKGKGIARAPIGSSSESVKDKDSNASSSTEAPTKNIAAASASASSRNVTRKIVVPFALDLNELPADGDEKDQTASPVDLTLSLWVSPKFSK